jgi:hypothetical protein
MNRLEYSDKQNAKYKMYPFWKDSDFRLQTCSRPFLAPRRTTQNTEAATEEHQPGREALPVEKKRKTGAADRIELRWTDDGHFMSAVSANQNAKINFFCCVWNSFWTL